MSESSNTPTSTTPSQEDEALAKARAAEARLPELDKSTFAAASYVRAEPLSRKGAEALARLETALAPLPTETASRRRVMKMRKW